MSDRNDLRADLAERVAVGAAWLDKMKPGWERLVDPAALQMQSPSWCICGLVFAVEAKQRDSCGYYYAENMFPSPVGGGVELGFSTDRGVPAWRILDELWLTLVKERFDTGELSDA